MSEDLLRDATDALRKTTESVDDGAALWSRIHATLQRRRRARQRLLTWALPAAAVFIGGSALAATGTLPATIRTLRSLIGMEVPASSHLTVTPAPLGSAAGSQAAAPGSQAAPSLTPPAAASVSASASNAEAPSTVSSGDEPVILAPAPPAPPAAPVVTEDGHGARRPAAARVPSSVQTGAPTSAQTAAVEDSAVHERDLELYRRAHRLHFTEHDWSAALVAWETYLREAPVGTLGVEARYNRALCLVRLERTTEARAALQPFALGTVSNGYRQDEARKLLEALER